MVLIVESGATKTDWLALAGNGTQVSVKTGGMNISSMPEDVVNEVVESAVAEFRKSGVSQFESIHFYAAGLICQPGEAVPAMAATLDKVMRGFFQDASIEYASDTLAAARAVCGHEPGVVRVVPPGVAAVEFAPRGAGEAAAHQRAHLVQVGRGVVLRGRCPAVDDVLDAARQALLGEEMVVGLEHLVCGAVAPGAGEELAELVVGVEPSVV